MDAIHDLYVCLAYASCPAEIMRGAMAEYIRLANEVGEVKAFVASLLE